MKKREKEETYPKQNLGFTENVLEETVKKLDKKYVNLENQCNKLCNNSLQSEYFCNKLLDLENRSRRNNLRIDGITEGPSESWEQCEEQLQDVFKEKLGLNNVQIKRTYRVRNKRNKDKKTKPRAIVCKILSYIQKKEVLRNEIFIHEDFLQWNHATKERAMGGSQMSL